MAEETIVTVPADDYQIGPGLAWTSDPNIFAQPIAEAMAHMAEQDEVVRAVSGANQLLEVESSAEPKPEVTDEVPAVPESSVQRLDWDQIRKTPEFSRLVAEEVAAITAEQARLEGARQAEELEQQARVERTNLVRLAASPDDLYDDEKQQSILEARHRLAELEAIEVQRNEMAHEIEPAIRDVIEREAYGKYAGALTEEYEKALDTIPEFRQDRNLREQVHPRKFQTHGEWFAAMVEAVVSLRVPTVAENLKAEAMAEFRRAMPNPNVAPTAIVPTERHGRFRYQVEAERALLNGGITIDELRAFLSTGPPYAPPGEGLDRLVHLR